MGNLNVYNHEIVRLFVYGTLMSDYHNSRYFDNDYSKYVGPAITNEKYEMIASGIPFVNPNIPTHKIHGEVWEVNTNIVLPMIDRLEGHPKFYVRTPIKVTLTTTGEMIEASIYFCDKGNGEIVENGDYRNYRLPTHLYDR